MSTAKEIDGRIDRAMARVRTAFRAVVTALTTDGPVVLLQCDALAGEALQDNELMQHFGFTSAPPADTMCIVLPVGGKTAHGVIVATEHGTLRLKGLLPGEAAVYNSEGDVIILRKNREMEIVAGVKVKITSPLVEIIGDVTVTGTVTAAVDVIGGGISLNSHTHGGVEPGGSNTGGPS